MVDRNLHQRPNLGRAVEVSIVITNYMAKDPPELTPEQVKRALARPESFAYFGDNPDMFETWTMGPVIQHRDSPLIDRSNAAVLKRELEKHPEWSDDYAIDKANHWAVGWVEHLTYRVVDAEGKSTPIARFVREWFRYLKDEYPIADEDHYSTLECEASWEWISQDGPRVAGRLGYILPDDWQDKVMTWWDAHRSNALESRDDQGASPDDDDYRAAFEALGFTKEEE